MKIKIILLALVSIVFYSCKKTEEVKVTEEITTEPPIVQVTTAKECYEYIKAKDTIKASFTVISKNVTGDLMYKLFQKDKNYGTIAGTVSGDTLYANYTFMSEGVESVRQIVFLRKNKTLVEGYGEITEIKNKIVFKDTKKLDFTKSFVLNEIPCK